MNTKRNIESEKKEEKKTNFVIIIRKLTLTWLNNNVKYVRHLSFPCYHIFFALHIIADKIHINDNVKR